MSTTEVKLARPVEVDGVTHTSLTLRLPTVEDYTVVRRLNVGSELRYLKLIARLSGVDTRSLARIFFENECAAAETGGLVKSWFGY